MTQSLRPMSLVLAVLAASLLLAPLFSLAAQAAGL
jgi:hypothetical protein